MMTKEAPPSAVLPPTSQKAKMLAGELYLASDLELTADHRRALSILERFNASRADEDTLRLELLKEQTTTVSSSWPPW